MDNDKAQLRLVMDAISRGLVKYNGETMDEMIDKVNQINKEKVNGYSVHMGKTQG